MRFYSRTDISRMRPCRCRVSTNVFLGLVMTCGTSLRAQESTEGGGAAVPGVRAVSLGGSVTETIVRLGMDSVLVGVDASSLWPEWVLERVPNVGYYRTMNTEGVLSLAPELLIAAEGAGPPEALSRIREAGVSVRIVPSENTVAGIRAKIRAIAEALGVKARGEALVDELDGRFEEVRRRVEARATQPKVLFIWGQGGGTLLAGGAGTAAAEMIRLAGGRNAVDTVDGYKPISSEALLVAAPDVIVVDADLLAGRGGIDGLLRVAGIAQTPAGRERRVIAVDVLAFLGFGPRAPEALETVLDGLEGGW